MKIRAPGRRSGTPPRALRREGLCGHATREICQRAGITKPVLYYHFESKERLFRDMVLEAWKECRQELQLAAQHVASAREHDWWTS